MVLFLIREKLTTRVPQIIEPFWLNLECRGRFLLSRPFSPQTILRASVYLALEMTAVFR